MKMTHVTPKSVALGETSTPQKSQSPILLEDRPSGKSCGVRLSKDGVTFMAFYPGANTVQIAGNFNNWQPNRTPMKKADQNGLWVVKLPLKAGTYCYRHVVDGRWCQDPYNEAAEPNSYGEFNSVIHVH